MTYILVIWTVVGFAGAGKSASWTFQKAYDWRPIGEFRTIESCQKAAADMVVVHYRCLAK